MQRILIAFLSLASIGLAASYEVAPAPGTQFALTVEKTGLYRGKKHLFVFEKYGGKLVFDPQKPEQSSIQLTIDSKSAVCKDDWVSANDIKKVMEEMFGNMLAVKDFPTMTFSSTSIRPLGGDRFEAQGMLTIRNKPKPVTVSVQLDAADPRKLRLRGNATINLKHYGLKPPSALLGAIGTKEEMPFAFDIVAVIID
jgi:polyisoprenoid-binding protein YceI